MPRLVLNGGRLVVKDGAAITDTGCSDCACDPDTGEDCDGSASRPDGCFNLNVSGIMQSDCQRFDDSNTYSEVSDFSVSVNITFDTSDYVGLPLAFSVPIWIRLDVLNATTGEVVARSYRCNANVLVGFACRDGMWGWSVGVSVGEGCDDPPPDAVPTGWNQELFISPFGEYAGIGSGIDNAVPTGEPACRFYLGSGGTATLSRVGDCGQPEHLVYADSCDDGSRVTVDIATRPPFGYTCLFAGGRYTPTSELSSDEAVEVVWSDDPCPDELEGDLFQRCPGSPTPEYYRIPDAGNAPFVRVSALGAEYSDGNQLCRDQYLVSYARIPDDGRTAPSHGFIEQTLQCAGPELVKLKATCRLNPNDPGDPTIPPFDPASGAGLGDAVARAIELVTMGKVKPCSSCNTRKQILNRFGKSLGQAVIDRLRL